MKQTILSFIALALMLIAGCSQPKNADKKQLAQTRLQLGLAYLMQGDRVQAKKNIQKAIDYAPKDSEAYSAMALYLRISGENEQAEYYHQRALTLSDGHPGVRIDYGGFLCSLRKYQPAQQQFSKALKMLPDDRAVDVLVSAGYRYLKAGQPEKARPLLARVVKDFPDQKDNLLNQAEWLLQQKEYRQVRLLLEVSELASPMTPQILWLRIRLAAGEKNATDIKYYGQQLAHHFPQSEQYRRFLANEY